jgi:signal transduction histidine kinase/CheY-like chemotaxis protein
MFDSFNHFIAPSMLGLISAVSTYLYWRKKNIQRIASEQYTRSLNSLLDVNFALISSLDLDKILQIIIDKSVQLLNLDSGAIYLNENEKLYLGATTPPLPDGFPDMLRYDSILNHPNIKKCQDTKSHIVIEDTFTAELSEAEQKVVEIRNLRSILYIPLVIENRTIGTLILGTCFEPRIFSAEEINLYSTFSSQSALAIENARLFKRSKLIADELRKKNEEFLTLNDTLNEKNYKIQKINEDLKLAKELAEESDRLKTSFLQNMSHEVRTPLNAIVGFSQLISESNLTSAQLKLFAEKILANSDKLIGIITDVIELSQVQSNQAKIKTNDIDVVLLVNKTVDSFREIAKEKNIALIFNQNIEFKELFVQSDEGKLKKVFSHLIHNALKFTQAGSVEITCEMPGNELRLSIADTGIGIAKETQDIIFEPFHQVESGITRNYGGNGIGLSLVKAYTELLSGNISLTSEINQGTTVNVIIPLTLNGHGSGITVNEPVGFQGLNFDVPSTVDTILIVEDEYNNFLYLYELLQPTSIEILHATNGQQAIDMCRKNSAIDLILMDIRMPVMDGCEAAKIIREFRPGIPIIAQTAYTLEHENIENISVFNDYIIKPINKYEFREKMMVYIER